MISLALAGTLLPCAAQLGLGWYPHGGLHPALSNGAQPWGHMGLSRETTVPIPSGQEEPSAFTHHHRGSMLAPSTGARDPAGSTGVTPC